MNAATQKQLVVLKAIRRFHSLPPTVAEVARLTGLSENAVVKIYAALEKKGWLSRTARTPGSIRLTHSGMLVADGIEPTRRR